MKKSELKALIREVVEETRHEGNVVLLREFFKNDLNEHGLNEGVGDFVKTKMVQPIVNFLLGKLKTEDPKRSELLSKAVQEKDEKTIKSLFDDPKIKSAEKEITNDVVNEYATRISEENDKPSLIKSITSYIKNNPKLSTVVILALLGLIGAAVYGSGGVVPLLIAMGKGALGASKAGAIGGAAISGAKSIYNQTKDGGNVKLGKLAKDTAIGAGIGAATSAVGGAIAPMIGAAGKGIADLGGVVASLIKTGNQGESALARIISNPDTPKVTRGYAEALIAARQKGTITPKMLDDMADGFIETEKWVKRGGKATEINDFMKDNFRVVLAQAEQDSLNAMVQSATSQTFNK